MGLGNHDFMHPRLYKERPEGEEWGDQLKVDGQRAMGYIALNAGYGRLFSKSHNPITDEFPQISQELPLAIPDSDAVIDGEIASLVPVWDGTKWVERDNRHALSQRKGKLVLFIFDILRLGQEDLTIRPFHERMDRLGSAIRPQEHVVLLDTYWSDTDKEDLWRFVAAGGYEGIVSKQRNSKYREGVHSPMWRKVKPARQPAKHAAR